MVYAGTYETDGVFIEYEYYIDAGDWEQPPHSEVEIKSMEYENADVHDLLYNIANDWYENVKETIEEYHKDRI
jgi:hypothetical protein